MGFLFECIERLGDQAERVFDCINNVFSWLPLAATIEGAIFCVHGGPGNMKTMEEINTVPRGTTNLQAKAVVGELLNDLLWSDPTDHDSILGIVPNPQRGSVYYGPDIVHGFLSRNGFGPNGAGMLVRAHECTTDGFDLHSGGRCVTVFSATNYCGIYQNTGAVLEVFWDHAPGEHQLLVQAKLIGPGVGSAESIDHDNWQQVEEDRPATPPRNWSQAYEQLDELQLAQAPPRPPTPLRRSGTSSGDLAGELAGMTANGDVDIEAQV